MPVTLRQHVRERHGQALAKLLDAISVVACQLEKHIRTAPLSGALGALGQTNVQGEQQQKLDVFANDMMISAMRSLPSVAAAISEENDEPIFFPGKPDAQYVVIFDPLDGSSNIDVDVNVGTIVSIQAVLAGGDSTAAALKPGASQAAALYVNYGPATMLVYTAGQGVHSFTLSEGEFLLNAADVRIPSNGSYYSVNESNAADFPTVYREYLSQLRDGAFGRKYSSRYVGSFIADFHRTLLKGGVFLYPPTAKAPSGKLRLLYEANPLAMIAEQAGGAATNGNERILDLVPRTLHERTTLVIGGSAEIAAFSHLVAYAGLEE